MARTALRAVVALGAGVAVALPTGAVGAPPAAAPPAAAPPAAAPPAAARAAAPQARTAPAAGPVVPTLPKLPVMRGSGGAVASVDEVASQVGIDVLRRGGNAVDAAVATAAALGVTEPYSAGIGGGGFFVFYNTETGRIRTLDGRETAPRTFNERTFTDDQGRPLNFADAVSSGLSVGVPGTPLVWEEALERWGTQSLSQALRPAERVARRGFVVDQTFRQQTLDNEARFRKFPETARVYLPGGSAPAVGSTFRNPDMARTYRLLRRQGTDVLYRGQLGRELVAEARNPHTAPGVQVFRGQLTERDLADYRAPLKLPTRTTYRGLDVYGMPVPSSGGIAVGESVNLLEAYDSRTGRQLSTVDEVQYLHRFAEATATAFADRGRWVGDVRGVPTRELLNQRFANERACQLFDPARAHARPIPFGSPDGSYSCSAPSGRTTATRDDLGTTHLTTADRWGNVVAYTLTIEQTGGSGITVPGRGFLLNNELTDFNFVPATEGVPDPNLPGASKRPRSSMSPTIVLDRGRPVLALGSPGGATIITTVTQVLTEHVDRGLPLVAAIAAPRISSRNGAQTDAEPAVVNGPQGAGLRAMGHSLRSVSELGAATAIRLFGRNRFEAAAEPTRRGGGSAMVVRQNP
jgi:gamma-glutamyltranspeptidase/glutathione hydrolase